ANERAATADVLAHIAEVDERKLYLPAAYPSMIDYCVGELRLSEDAAAKRLHAGRVARRCPGVFAALADGRVHRTAVNLLAAYLTPETADELVAAAAHKSNSEIRLLLAERFPQTGRPELVRPIPPARTDPLVITHAPEHVGALQVVENIEMRSAQERPR